MSSPLDEDARALGRERALAARRERASIKRELREGSLTPAEVLARRMDDPVVSRMKVTDLLESLPGIGPARAAQVLDRCHISPTRRLRGLGDHQAAALVECIGGRP